MRKSKLSFANTAYPDQTAPARAVRSGYTDTAKTKIISQTIGLTVFENLSDRNINYQTEQLQRIVLW